MDISSDSIQHKLKISQLNTIGLVDEYENVVYEVSLHVNSELNFEHTYTTTQTRNPEQTGTETKIIEIVEYLQNSSKVPPRASLIKEDGIAYYEYPKTEVGIVVEKEIEVPVYDIPEPIEEEIELTEEKTISEFSAFSIQFNTRDIENFVPFEELTEELIFSWISESTIESYLNYNKDILLNKQDQILNPSKYQKIVQVPPWQTNI